MPHAYSLDALRLAASLALLLGHLTTERTLPAPWGMLFLGGLSSAFFFLLAGYLGAATPGLFERPYGQTARRRALRLLPPHWIGFVLLLPFALVGSSRLPLAEVIQTCAWWLSGLHNLAPEGTFSRRWNYPAWAITPLLLGGLSLYWVRFVRLREWTAQGLIPLLVLLLGVRMGLDLFPAPPTEVEESIRRHTLTFPRLLEVWAGAVAAILLRTPPPWLGKDLTLAGLLAASLALLAGGYLMDGREGVYLATHGLFAPLGILLVASAFHNRGRIYRLCQHPVIVFGGQVSILLWMLHIPVDTIAKHLAIRIGFRVDDLYGWPFVVASSLATLITASLANTIPWPGKAAMAKPESQARAAG